MADTSTREKTILCVDDNEQGLRIRQAMLQTFGFETRVAASGTDALEIMKATHVDAVVLDYRMPAMNGAELTESIKKLHPNTPVIMLTGYPYECSATHLATARRHDRKGRWARETARDLAPGHRFQVPAIADDTT